MKVYGLTGGIGAGKSIVSKLFQILGVPVYDADKEAKRLTHTDPSIKETVLEVFGPTAFLGNSLNRKFVSVEAFKDPVKLQKLNESIHPAVARDYLEWFKKQKGPYALREAALIYETNTDKGLDGVILVSAPEELRIERVLKRDTHRNIEQVQQIIQKQIPEDKKRALATFHITNDNKHMLIPQVLSLHQKLLES